MQCQPPRLPRRRHPRPPRWSCRGQAHRPPRRPPPLRSPPPPPHRAAGLHRQRRRSTCVTTCNGSPASMPKSRNCSTCRA
ncbi:MAG: hypothetical protein C0484_28045 [Rhodospirillum sp.]|nr:hypothetical protein [Rhodospirillum sp.]